MNQFAWEKNFKVVLELVRGEFLNNMKEIQSLMTCDTTIINSMKLERFRVYFSVKLSVVFLDALHQFESKIPDIS